MNEGKICISICAANADDLLEQIQRAAALADVVEIRFDCLEENQIDAALIKISNFKFAKPFLATLRPTTKTAEFSIGEKTFENAGYYADENKDRTNRLICWSKILTLENLQFVDFDEDLIFGILAKNSYQQQLSEQLENLEIKARCFQTVASSHDYEKIPAAVNEDFENLSAAHRKALSGRIVKIAAQADDITDTIPIWQLLAKAKAEDEKIIPIAMGESGKWTRILGLAHGAPLTYAALATGSETAPGQISAQDLSEIYRVKELNEETEIYGVIAGDTSYSMSPFLHNAVFAAERVNAVFVPLQVNDLNEFMRRMVKPETREIELNFKGFAVTNPHKTEIIKYLDEIDETARQIGAVNTVKIENGKFYGYNTDAPGFIKPLLDCYGDLRGAKVAVFGAGGAARACVYALKNAGAEVTIFARSVEKARRLADEFGANFSVLKTDCYDDFDVLVNATPLGTKGMTENETVARAAQMAQVKLVYDLIYNPFTTRLMREADRADVPKIGGLAMLAAQAAAQQKIWTGKEASVSIMSRAALRRLS